MQGIALSQRFFVEVVEPWLTRTWPDLRYAAALIGYGSELLGFDDETSRDHNWGPRIHIYVSEKDFAVYARPIVDAFSAAMPVQFLGEPIGFRNRPHPVANGPGSAGAMEHGLEVHTLETRLEQHVGLRSLEGLTNRQWLGFAEQKLLSFTAGAVFRDDDGRLTDLRAKLAYFPDDVWRYKLACQWRRIAEEQAFVGRAGQVGDDLGSRVIAARLVRDVMAMAFLLERRYAPYPKWFGSGFARLPMAAALTPHLDATLRASDWHERQDALAAAYLVLAERQNAAGLPPFTPVVGPYFERPFTTINADDAGAAARAAISDPWLKSLPTIGAIDQISDLTPLLTEPVLTQNVVEAVFDHFGPSMPSAPESIEAL